MKPRRWYVTPELTQWRYMTACGEYAGPLFSFPHNPSGIDPWAQNRAFHDLMEYGEAAEAAGRRLQGWLDGKYPLAFYGPAGWTPEGPYALTDEGWKKL
jgi:hypothetical protein